MSEDGQLISKDFFIWTRYRDTSEIVGNYTHLMDYIAEWVESGEAIETCAGDHAAFLLGVVFIIAEYTDDPTCLGYHDEAGTMPRQVEGLFDLDASHSVFLNPLSWKRQVLRYMAPRR